MNELTLVNIAVDLEMSITNRHEKKYHSERSRNKDIIADYKEAVRRAIDQTEDKAEEAILHGLSYLLNNAYLDDRTPAEFNELLNEVIRFLKRAEDPVTGTETTQNPFRTTTTKPQTYTHEDFFGRR